jgi:DUF971 family protein
MTGIMPAKGTRGNGAEARRDGWSAGLDGRRSGDHGAPVQPVDITPFPNELAIRWSDGREDFLPLETLRRFCPCAGCLGEKDIFGTTYKPPEKPYGPHAFQLKRLGPVGGYAVQPVWGDGHGTGLYTWEWLRRVGDAVSAGSPNP